NSHAQVPHQCRRGRCRRRADGPGRMSARRAGPQSWTIRRWRRGSQARAAAMTRLAITHQTRYEYDREVRFGEWRLMRRPTDSRARRVVSAGLEIAPPGRARWAYDAFGNSVCYLNFEEAAQVLSVTSRLVVDRYPNPIDASPGEPEVGLPVLYDTA